jgi:hypothetical protein
LLFQLIADHNIRECGKTAGRSKQYERWRIGGETHIHHRPVNSPLNSVILASGTPAVADDNRWRRVQNPDNGRSGAPGEVLQRHTGAVRPPKNREVGRTHLCGGSGISRVVD